MACDGQSVKGKHSLSYGYPKYEDRSIQRGKKTKKNPVKLSQTSLCLKITVNELTDSTGGSFDGSVFHSPFLITEKCHNVNV